MNAAYMNLLPSFYNQRRLNAYCVKILHGILSTYVSLKLLDNGRNGILTGDKYAVPELKDKCWNRGDTRGTFPNWIRQTDCSQLIFKIGDLTTDTHYNYWILCDWRVWNEYIFKSFLFLWHLKTNKSYIFDASVSPADMRVALPLINFSPRYLWIQKCTSSFICFDWNSNLHLQVIHMDL